MKILYGCLWIGSVCLIAVASAISLEEAIHLGWAHHPDLLRISEDIVLLQTGQIVQQEKFHPEWKFSGQGMVESQGASVRTGPAGAWNTAWGTRIYVEVIDGWGDIRGPAANWSVEQPLLRGAGRIVNEASLFESKQQLQLQYLTQTDQRAQVALRIAHSYYQWQQTLRGQFLESKALESSMRLAHAVHARIEAGRLPALDAAQIDAQLLRQRAQLMQAERRSHQAYTQLWAQIGLDPPMPPPVLDEMTLSVPDLMPLAVYQTAAQENSLILKRLKLEAAIAHRRQLTAENQSKIDLDLRFEGDIQGRYSTEIQPWYSTRNSWRGILYWSIPLGARSARRYPLQQASLRLNQLQRQEQEAKRQIAQEVQQLWETAESQHAQWMLFQESIELAEKSCQNSEKKLEAGRQSVFEVIALCEQPMQTSMAYLDLQAAYIQTVYTLENAVGLWMKRWESSANVAY